ncbi:MAG: NOL1/NOP2/sun family putative RNA methylase [Ruminococcaceae bacterium]|nr:NOL1/NOP2/sun family putative RNA methylase [Oscillospiraceae bacterium]
MEFPKEFSARMKEMLKDEYDSFLDAFSLAPIYTGIRINSNKQGAFDKVLSRLDNPENVKWCPNGYYTTKDVISGKDPYHLCGLVYFQEPSAMSTVEALDIAPGDYVLDLCAAPGGKATHAAEKLKGEGILVANEIIPKRSKILAENIQRMGIKNAIVTNESPERLAEKYPEFFDKIIVDAPCSGEGMFRKEPQAIDEWSTEHTLSCAQRQKMILESAFCMLKKGGKLVYSTCTFAPCENEGVVQWVLENIEGTGLCQIDIEGMTDGKSEFVNSEHDLSATKRIFPHISKGEGHFVALFEKNNGNINNFEKTYKCGKITEYLNFQKDNLNCNLEGEIIDFGENLYLMPKGIDIDKIKVLLPGLHLGVCKKGRFEPSHALCLALEANDFKRTFSIDSTEKYYRGETIACNENGWTAVLYDGFPIGWGKATGGVLKNHYPKYLRF